MRTKQEDHEKQAGGSLQVRWIRMSNKGGGDSGDSEDNEEGEECC